MATLTTDEDQVRPHDGPDATDPRFRARRALVAAERTSRRRRAVRAGLIVLTLIAGGLAGLRSPLLDVDDVVVQGAVATSPEQVSTASGLVPGLALVEVDAADATARLEALPWVRSATVGRSWWGTVSITLVERTAATQVADGDRYLLVDATGRVVATSVLATPSLVTIEGSEAADPGGQLGPRYAEAAQIAALLPPGVATRVVAIRTNPDGRLSLALRSRGTVVWGSADQPAAKVRALTTILGQVDLVGLCTIDVRVPTTPVVTRDC